MQPSNAPTELIVLQADYERLLTSLPQTGSDGLSVESAPIMTREYRKNVSETINGGKWIMWRVAPRPLLFTWQNGAWQPPTNLVIRRD